MRLYLSSFRLGQEPQHLTRMAGSSRRALVVVNSCDLFAEPERAPRVRQEIEALRGLGFEPEELDLRRYFREPNAAALAQQLSGAGLVWVRGGNPFVLIRAMRRTGFSALLREQIVQNALVYGGYSAGVAMLTPSLHGIELVDDPKSVPEGYDSEVIWDCLGLLDYFVAPHYRSDHPESAAIDKVVEYFIDHHMFFRALRDGEAIVVEGKHEQLVGRR